ncbi:MAG TPA: hypothetical protein VM890_05875 [Longimicrobium sp.]|nr:hypothetical protein [Longimicrobium sp.]
MSSATSVPGPRTCRTRSSWRTVSTRSVARSSEGADGSIRATATLAAPSSSTAGAP